MNKDLNLVEILKNCSKGFPLYSPLFGTVYLKDITPYNIHISTILEREAIFEKNGRYFSEYENAECSIFPSQEQRDWSKFKTKKPKFDYSILKPFDKVLCRNGPEIWRCDFFSFYMETYMFPNVCIGGSYMYCIPYNDETKHLLGTTNGAPEFYKYWKD